MRLALLIPLLAATFALASDAPQRAKPQVALALVAEADAVVPGATITVALRLTHEPGWHTYWRNPGTVGLAPRITWTLPDGFTAGPVQWQQPQLTKMAAYTVWGYEGDALLLTDITVPAETALPVGSQATISAAVLYMACAKNCCPDEAKLSITLPVRREANAVGDWRAKFDAVRRQQPVTTDAWRADATSEGDTFTLTLTPTATASVNAAVDSLCFYGYDRLISSNEPQHFRRDGDKLVLTLRREAHSPEPHTRLRGIVCTPAGLLPDGAAAVLAIDAPIVGH